MMKILIGHDGSQSADAALVDLQRAGLPIEADPQVLWMSCHSRRPRWLRGERMH